MRKNDSQDPNPTLVDLEVLVGHWEMELSNASLLPRSSDTVTGHVSFEWLEDGAFIIMYMNRQPPSPQDAVWLISRDESSSKYLVFY